MAIFTNSGRIVLAQALLNMELHMAVGSGDPAWDSLPAPTTPEAQAIRDAEWSQLTALTAPVGLARTRDKFFVKPDVNGTIPMNDGGLYSQSAEPTPYIYVRFQLDLADALGETLRENGVFVGSQIAADVPSGQMFIEPDDIISFGQMIQVDRVAPVVRDGSISQTLSTILTM